MVANTIQLEADYLVIGAGASGMAFVDELISHNSDTTVIIIDKRSTPGGHWNDAYNFVQLHQPATFYGVNSKALGKGGKDLATQTEIKAYYELVMKDFLDTGRVKFFLQCEYQGNGVFYSLLAQGKEYTVNVHKKIVDATYVTPVIPSTHTPNFKISEGVNFVPINGLSYTKSAWKRYLIIGGGKTSIDAIIYLLKQSVDPESIVWVIPNDSWFFNRDEFFPDSTWVDGNIKLLSSIPDHDDHAELFKKWEEDGFLFRIDPSMEPTRFKGGTISSEELKHLRRIKNILRYGRIRQIHPTCIIFQSGMEIETDRNTLHVDCSANGSSMFIPKKIFNGDKIIIQDIRAVQTAYSAAVIAALENRFPNDEDRKNTLLKPIFRHQTASEFIICILQDIFNEGAIASTLGYDWIRKSRLHPLHHASPNDYERFLNYGKLNGAMLVETLQKLVRNIETDKPQKEG